MHLKCDCLILNDQQQSTIKKKPLRCILTYGTVKKKGFLRIINQSQKDLLTCPLEDNVEKFFNKFLGDGKLTIKFKVPKLEVLISKADPTSLNSFFRGVRMLSEGKDVDRQENVPVLKTSHIKRDDFSTPVKIVNVQRRQDYPFYTSLHSSLQQFTANNCLLTKIDQRLSRLKNLCVLNLANNRLSNDQANLNFSTLTNLVNLDLSSNGLQDLDSQNFYENLPISLKYLNLSDNLLNKLPDAVFTRLKNLHTLNLANNRLARLSWKIYRLRSRLKNLNISQNRLKFLPASIGDLKLDHFDASNNPWQADYLETSELLKAHLPLKGTLPPLLYLCLRAVEYDQLCTDNLPEILRLQLEYDLEVCAQCKCVITAHQVNIAGFAFMNAREFSVSYVNSGSLPVRKLYCLKCNGGWTMSNRRIIGIVGNI